MSVACLALTAAAFAPLAQAQARSPDSLAVLLQHELARNSWLRLTLDHPAQHEPLEVRVLGVHPSSFTVRRVFPPQDTTAVAYPALVSLWRKNGSHAWYGAAIGGILLGLAGAQLGMLACSDTGVDTSGCERSGAIGGAVAGVALGALLGASYPRWQLLYDRPSISAQ